MYNELLAQASGLSGYGFIAIWKVIVFLIFFCLWAWVGQWIDKDAKLVHTNRSLWNNIYFFSGLIGLVLWFMLPAPFIVEILLFVVIWATSSIIYILHRNSRVPQNQRILTPDHIRWMFSFEESKRSKKVYRLVFITVNGNEVPAPYKNDEEYNGYVFAEDFLHDLWQRRVSHAELVPIRETYQVLHVIDGIKTKGEEFPREDALDGIQYLKSVAGLDVEDRRRPQEGSFFTIRTGESNTGWRISTSGSTRGEQLVLERIEEDKTFTLETIGLQSDQQEKLKDVLQGDNGVVLVTGTKESGVTTSLYSLVNKHDAFIKNIHSFEKEYLKPLDNITQHKAEPKGPDSKNHAQQLRSVLHSDPDIIMIGFIDEPEMADVATKASLGGKRMYFAMESPSTFHALQQWMKMVGDNRKAADTLVAITNQKLIRILCTECRQAYAPDVNMLKRLNLPSEKIKQFYRPPTEVEYDKHGNPILCPNCQGTGYFGRTAVFELLVISDSLRKLIAEDAPINAIRTQCRKERMLFLQEEALRKVIDGTTSIQEVLRVTTEKEGVKKKK